MKQSISRKLINKISSWRKNKKQLGTAVLLLAILGTTLPVCVFAWDPLFDVVDYLVLLLMLGISVIIQSIATFVLSVAVGLLTLVISPTFINVPFTTNEFVTQGWSITRDLVNVGFIILLAIIGLGTALRIQEYQWQKTLPRLFGIILLINFTPVICGFIIDGANIFMNYFLAGASGWNALCTFVGNQFGLVVGALSGIQKTSGFYSQNIIAQTVSLFLLTCMGALVYFLYAALFAVRYVMIWILVILSPVAFFTYVFKESPMIKKIFPGPLHWEEWWNQFIQWTIIGITMAFFLYLSNNLLGLATSGAMTFGSIPSTIIDDGGWFNSSIPYLISLALLLVGFLISTQSAPMGAGAIISHAKKAQSWGARKIYANAPKAVGKATGKIARIPGKIAGMGYKIATGKKLDDKIKKSYRNWTKKNPKWTEKGEKLAKNMGKTKEETKRVLGLPGKAERELGDEKEVKRHERLFKQHAAKDRGYELTRSDLGKNEKVAAENVMGTHRPDLLKEEKIKEAVEKQSPEKFANNIMEKGFSHDVLEAMDQDKYDAMGGKKGSPAKRKAIMESIMKEQKNKKTGKMENIWLEKAKEIEKTDSEKHDRMCDIFDKLHADPNYFNEKGEKDKDDSWKDSYS